MRLYNCNATLLFAIQLLPRIQPRQPTLLSGPPQAESHNRSPWSVHDFPDFASSNSTPIDQSHKARIELALADIGDQIAPNYAEYARKYKLVPSTLSQRHRGITTCKRVACQAQQVEVALEE
jgi:hypothetical protein